MLVQYPLIFQLHFLDFVDCLKSILEFAAEEELAVLLLGGADGANAAAICLLPFDVVLVGLGLSVVETM